MDLKQGGSSEKDKLTKKIKNITQEEAIQDFEHLKRMDLKTITNETRIGNKFVDFFTFRQRLETIGVKGFPILILSKTPIITKNHILKIC